MPLRMIAVAMATNVKRSNRTAIPVVKGVGTTWLDRGRPYQLRRATKALSAALVFVVSALITFAFATAIVSYLPGAIATVAVSVMLVVIVFSFYRFWLVLVIEPKNKFTNVTKNTTARREPALRAAADMLRISKPVRHLISAVLLGFSVPFCVGWGLAWLLATLRHDYPGELEARVNYMSASGLRKETRKR